MAAQHLNGLAIQRIHEAHRAVAIREVDDIVGDRDPVGHQERAIPPGAQEVAMAVKDDDGRIFALEAVDPIVRVRSHGTHHGKRLPRGQLGPVLD